MEVSELTLEEVQRKNTVEKIGILSKAFSWSPSPLLEKVAISISLPILMWMVAFLLVGKDGLPGGQIFALVVIICAGIALGSILELIKFPPLLGMLVVGIMIRNIPYIQFGKDLKEDVSSILRQIALVVILIRAGLGLDPSALRKMSTVVIRLAFAPCLVEATVLAIVSHFVLDFPWAWGFILGFVIAAVSPAVIVPCLLSLRDRGYGVAKGIPTIVIAAASIDDILAISAFGVALGFAHAHEEGSLVMMILKGPIEVVLGISFGTLWGIGLGLFISRSEKESKESALFRIIFTFAGGCLSVFGFQFLKFPGSGALGCLTAAFVASIIWRHKGVLDDNDSVNWGFQKLWFFFQPILFGLIGCEIDLQKIDLDAVLLGILCLCIGLAFRIVTSFFMVTRAGFNFKEKLFVAIAWLPKATVQAAIGPVAYDLAKRLDAGPVAEERGLKVLTIAVIAILITAPIGAIAIMIMGPRLLSNEPPKKEEDDMKTMATTTTVSQSYIEELVGEEANQKVGSKAILLKLESETKPDSSKPNGNSNSIGK